MFGDLFSRRYEGVTAYIGMPGSGKTYALVQQAARAMAEGRPVYTNAGFHVRGAEQYRTLEELLIIPDGSTILLDEAQSMFNARRWQEFPDGLLYRLSQIRKDGLEFYWSSQHEDFVDVTLRRLTFWFWHCRALTKRVLRRAKWAPQEFRRERERPAMREWVIVRKATAELYDTASKVAIPLSMLERIREASRDELIEITPGMSMRDVLALADELLGPLPPKRGRHPSGSKRSPALVDGPGRKPRIGEAFQPPGKAGVKVERPDPPKAGRTNDLDARPTAVGSPAYPALPPDHPGAGVGPALPPLKAVSSENP